MLMEMGNKGMMNLETGEIGMKVADIGPFRVMLWPKDAKTTSALMLNPENPGNMIMEAGDGIWIKL